MSFNLKTDNESDMPMTLFWKREDVNGYLCNWHIDGFTVGGQQFNCVEQWIMYSKAVMMGDAKTGALLLAEKDPKKQKAGGRKVTGFVEETWVRNRDRMLRVGLWLKFCQHPELRQLLLATGTRTLVEASPLDKIYGIGLAPNNPNALNKKQWRGQNVLGDCLMWVRDRLRAVAEQLELDPSKPWDPETTLSSITVPASSSSSSSSSTTTNESKKRKSKTSMVAAADQGELEFFQAIKNELAGKPSQASF